MAHYTLARLSDLFDHFTMRVIVCTEAPLGGTGIKSVEALPECKIIDAETGKELSKTDLEGLIGFELWRTLSWDARKAFFKKIEEYHQKQVVIAKEFLGL